MGWRQMLVVGVGLMSAQTARADELRAPQKVSAEPATKQSGALTTRAAIADMKGNPEQARELANQAIRADPRDPWPYYNKGMALAQLGETDGALAALFAAEQHFAPTDRWGRSVAIYGRAQALNMAGRCAEAVQAYAEYAAFVGKDDPQGAAIARRYAVDCRAPAPAAAPGPAPRVADPRAATSRRAERGQSPASTPPSRHCSSSRDMDCVQTGGVNPAVGPPSQVTVLLHGVRGDDRHQHSPTRVVIIGAAGVDERDRDDVVRRRNRRAAAPSVSRRRQNAVPPSASAHVSTQLAQRRARSAIDCPQRAACALVASGVRRERAQHHRTEPATHPGRS